MRRDPLQRFMASVDTRGSCWIWRRYCNREGYPQFWYDGRAWYAHRWAAVYIRGQRIPAGYERHHVCRDPQCVNPWHTRNVRAETHRHYRKARHGKGR